MRRRWKGIGKNELRIVLAAGFTERDLDSNLADPPFLGLAGLVNLPAALSHFNDVQTTDIRLGIARIWGGADRPCAAAFRREPDQVGGINYLRDTTLAA